MPYYVNQIDTGSVAGNVFDVVYDKTSLLTVGGDIGFQAGEKLMLNASAFYNFYVMDKQLQPWHRPAITGKFTGKYNLKDKIIISADVYYLGPQFGRTYTQDTLGVIAYDDVTIKHLIDLNLGVEYRYNQRFSAFVNFNNIASYRYYRWNQYPSQRFNFMVGLTANF
jgi:outer membrane receptor protein involved in Fe transport